MVKKLTVFAVLASIAMAAPTVSLDRRTVPSTRGLFGLGEKATVSISTSSGWNFHVASALSACRGGAAAGSVDAISKQALLAWLKGAGSSYLDLVTISELKSWCSGADGFVITAWAEASLDASLAADAAVSAAGGVVAFLNGVTFEGLGESTCVCSVLATAEQTSLLAWLESSVAGGLDVAISGALSTCASGGIAASLTASAQASLSAWLSSSECTLSAELKGLVLGWLKVSAKGSVTVSVGASADISVVLTSAYLSSLEVFIGASGFASLDVSIQVGLHACAVGGLATSLDASVQAALTTWIASSSCTLDADLKVAVGLWLEGSVGAGVVAAGSVSLPYVSAGATIASNLEASGLLIASAQSSLSAFLGTSASLAIDADILVALKACAADGLAASLDASVAASLSVWLSSSSCTLSSELRGTVIAWLSFGITGSVGAEVSVGIGACAAFTFSAEDIISLQAAISASTSLSATVKGALGFAIAGQSCGAVSIASRAELSAFLLGNTGLTFGGDLHVSLIGWICGSVEVESSCSTGGGGKSSGYPTISTSAKPKTTTKAGGYPTIATTSSKPKTTTKAAGYPTVATSSAKPKTTTKAAGYPTVATSSAKPITTTKAAGFPTIPAPSETPTTTEAGYPTVPTTAAEATTSSDTCR